VNSLRKPSLKRMQNHQDIGYSTYSTTECSVWGGGGRGTGPSRRSTHVHGTVQSPRSSRRFASPCHNTCSPESQSMSAEPQALGIFCHRLYLVERNFFRRGWWTRVLRKGRQKGCLIRGMEESDRSIGNSKTKGGLRSQANMLLPVGASENAFLASVSLTVEELIARLGLAHSEVGDPCVVVIDCRFLRLARFGNFVRGNGPSQSVTGSPSRAVSRSCGMIPYNKSRRESVSVSLQANHAPSITTMKTSPTAKAQRSGECL
jgi:hypothetical protein